MAGELKSRDYIFALLTALVKKEGGEIRISEKELISVTKSDIVKLLYDNKTKEFVLTVDAIAFLGKADDTIN